MRRVPNFVHLIAIATAIAVALVSDPPTKLTDYVQGWLARAAFGVIALIPLEFVAAVVVLGVVFGQMPVKFSWLGVEWAGIGNAALPEPTLPARVEESVRLIERLAADHDDLRGRLTRMEARLAITEVPAITTPPTIARVGPAPGGESRG